MAGNAVVGALRIVLGADTAALDKGLKDAQSSVSSFGNAMQIGMAAVAASAVAAAAALTVGIKSAIDSADNLNKLSQSTGLTTQQLSKLQYAAELSDVSTESFSKSIGKLSKAMVAASTEGASPAAQAFTAMGVSVKAQDGTLRSQSDVLSDVAEKFSGYRDGAEKTSLAITLFGKAGAGMIPLLNLGRDGLQEAGDEAEKFGLVLDKKTTVAAEAFNDNLKRMDKIKQGLVMTITAQMLPSFEQLSESLLEARMNSTLMSTAAEVLVGALKAAISVGLGLAVAVRSAAGEFSAFGTVLQGVFTLSPDTIRRGMTEFAAAEMASDEAGKALTATLANLWTAAKGGDVTATWNEQALAIRSLNKEVNLLGIEWAKTSAPIVSAADAGKNAIDKFLDSQAKRTAGQMAEAETIGKSVGAQAQLKIAYEANAIALANNIPLSDALNLRIAAAGDAAALAAMKIAGANVTLQAMSPAQQFEQSMTQLTALYDAGTISMETYAARQQQIAEQAGATWDQAGASIAGSFATISGAFGKEGSKMAMAAKVFGVIQGTISMFTGAAKALELPFPANIAAVAAVMAKGASLVASIKGQSVPTGMMTGGAMTVRGGGGPDSVPVSFMASPGEQIDVWRPDQGGGSDPRRGGGGGSVYNLPMPAVTTREAIGVLIEHLNDALGNGHQIKMVPV